MIKVEGLTKIFSGGTKAVDELDLNVEEGEILGLLGPNGAGKTTTISILATLSGFDEGKATVAGHNIDTHPEKIRSSIGYVAQKTGVDYFLTGRENLILQGQLYKMNKATILARVEELAAYFELTDSLDRLVSTYSGGMTRKLDIATALIHKPQVLFLDEPTLGLDIKSRKGLWEYITRLNQESNLTILLTTHYLEEADHLSHRVAIINEGKIRVVDTPEALKNSICGDSVTLSFESVSTEVQAFAYNLGQDGIVENALWEDDQLHVYVENGANSIPVIMQRATNEKAIITSLSLSQPTLDDVFLKYTGASLDNAKEEPQDEWWKQWAGKDTTGKWAKKWQEENPTETEQTKAPTSNDNSTQEADQNQWESKGQWDNQGGESGNAEDWKKWSKQDHKD